MGALKRQLAAEAERDGIPFAEALAEVNGYYSHDWAAEMFRGPGELEVLAQLADYDREHDEALAVWLDELDAEVDQLSVDYAGEIALALARDAVYAGVA